MVVNTVKPHCRMLSHASSIPWVFLCLSLFCLSPLARANPQCDSVLSNESLKIAFGRTQRPLKLASNEVNLLIWNVHKETDGDLANDFRRISHQIDLALFQEAVSGPEFTEPISQSNKELGWTLAKSFQRNNGEFTGVATGSRVQPLKEEVQLSPMRETLINTPKTILYSEFAIEGREDTLLVVNVHAINFVTSADYSVHIQQLVTKVRSHQGPLIVAGDFNTRNDSRQVYLDATLQQLGLTELEGPRAGFWNLDHAYGRGVRTKRVYDLSAISSSDHAPRIWDLTIDPPVSR